MNTQETLIIQKAIEEIENQTFGVTQQFLEVHEIDIENGQYKIARISIKDNHYGVHFHIKDEPFYFRIWLNMEGEVTWAETVDKEDVWFRATSENLNATEIGNMTSLQPTKLWNKGDINQKFKKVAHRFSAFIIEPDTEVEELNIKLENLITYLEQDPKGITTLVDKAEGYIQISIHFYNGNGMVGGPYLSNDHLKRIAALGLSIECDYFITGNPYKENESEL